jgi:hypothetical protein
MLIISRLLNWYGERVTSMEKRRQMLGKAMVTLVIVGFEAKVLPVLGLVCTGAKVELHSGTHHRGEPAHGGINGEQREGIPHSSQSGH